MNGSESKSIEKLNDRQKRAIPYIVGAPDIRKGCRAAGITPTTYHEWVAKNPVFLDALNEARNALISEELSKLKAGAGRAVDKLLKLVNSKNEEIARKAATTVLEIILKLKELGEVEDRLESIEKIVMERRVYR